MENLIQHLQQFLLDRGFTTEFAALATVVAGCIMVIFLAWLANLIVKRVILRLVSAAIARTQFKWDDAMLESGVFTRLSHLAPALVVNALGPAVLGESPEVLAGVRSIVDLYLLLIGLSVLFAVLNAGHLMSVRAGYGTQVPIKGFIQAFKLVASLFFGVVALAVILGKTPFYLLSGLGALTAVLLLVFRDAILGFVAGIMISVNQMVRVGDWIEMPKAGADGDVVDVSLTTVKVQNWDKTITTIPTYSLISDSFKNWRGMSEAGGRRIKRAIHLDLQTVRFADEAMLRRWRRIELLRGYLDEKLAEIAADNARRGGDQSILGNGRRLTNAGTFRAYCAAYLKADPRIHQDLTFIVRQLAPTAQGLPLEIYVFCNDIRWVEYEGVQSDIFDHLFSIIGEFDLRVFQQPTGHDLRRALEIPAAAECEEART